jgi:hypothetical protein
VDENLSINLQKCYDILDEMLDDETIQEIMEMKKEDSMIEYHFSIGMYIRNYWLRHGTFEMHELLSRELKLTSFKFQLDDISSIILETYWYYLHNKKIDIEKIYNKYGYSYLSASIPKINENIQKDIDEKVLVRIYYKYNDLLYQIHVYKIKNSTEYYIYDIKRRWKKISEMEYNKLYNEWN